MAKINGQQGNYHMRRRHKVAYEVTIYHSDLLWDIKRKKWYSISDNLGVRAFSNYSRIFYKYRNALRCARASLNKEKNENAEAVILKRFVKNGEWWYQERFLKKNYHVH